MKVAAIDCGTNTIRLLIAEADGQGGLIEHDRRQAFVGLGQGVDANHRFDPAALQRVFGACESYAEQLRVHAVEAVRFVATSATRDATNKEDLFVGVRSRLGVEPEVITGEEESLLSFRGALSGVPVEADPVLVMDSGGGSTELVRGLADGTILESTSIDIGSRRVRERYLHSDPPTDEEISAARAAVRRILGEAGVDLESVRTFIGVAGTVTTMSAVVQGLPEYQRAKVHRSRLEREQIGQVTDRLLDLSIAEVARLGPVSPERATVLCAGALVIDEIAQRVGSSVLIVSETDILDGIALGMLSR